MILKSRGCPIPLFMEKVAVMWEGGKVPAIPDDGIIYLGHGYWRMKVGWQDEDEKKMLVASLMNPSCSQEEIAIVERGLAIVFGFERVNGEPRALYREEIEELVAGGWK